MPVTPVPGLAEGSGLAISRRQPRRFFAINDSDAPELIVLEANGSVRGKVTVRGATVVDWEDVTSGPCPAGNCIYIGDIGDNDARRQSITIYRVLEPRDGEQVAVVSRFDAVYPDQPHDAEALFTGPTGRLFLVTKEARGAAIYGFPQPLVADAPNRLERVAAIDGGSRRDRLSRVTDAESSSDGRTVAIRTNDQLYVLPTDVLVSGNVPPTAAFTLRSLREPQGEGVALGAGGEVFLAGEGGGRQGAGTFAALRCPQVSAP